MEYCDFDKAWLQKSYVIIVKIYKKKKNWKKRENAKDNALNVAEGDKRERKLNFKNRYSKKKCSDKFDLISSICLVIIAGFMKVRR